MKKYALILYVFLFFYGDCAAQNVGIGTSNPDASAQLDVSSISKGLLVPRMTGAVINSLNNPAKGLLVYDSTVNLFKFNAGNKTVPNWQAVGSNNWNVRGNAGTNPSIHFIGTTDNVPLSFRIHNIPAGKIDSAYGNTSLGYRAGHISTGKYNTAMGYRSLAANTAGEYNVALGYMALAVNTTGVVNTANGAYSLNGNTTGSYNTADGFNTMTFNTTGSYNVASGYEALLANTEGGGNVGVGYSALRKSGASNYNSALGSEAGAAHSTGWNNTFLGSFSNAETIGLFNCIAIGNGATVFENSQVRIGNSVNNSIGGYAGWTNLSDGRFKTNIRENVQGLAFIMKLRPVTYQLDMAGLTARLHETQKKSWNADMQKASAAKAHMIQTGFVAQEVEKAAQELGYDFSGVDKPTNEKDLYGLRYAEFVVPLVKAVQEQQQLIRTLTQKLETIQAEIAALQGK